MHSYRSLYGALKRFHASLFALSLSSHIAWDGSASAAPGPTENQPSGCTFSFPYVCPEEEVAPRHAHQGVTFEAKSYKAVDESFLVNVLDISDEIHTAYTNAMVDNIETRVAALEVMQFTPTTTLSGQSTFVLGGSSFEGSASDLVDRSSREYGATTFNYDTRLMLDTSFNGRDLLHIRLRAGNFDSTRNSFGGAGPSALSQLEVAFQEASRADRFSVNRLYYQVPVGDFTFTIGPRVEQDNMLAVWPSLYPSDSILDLMTFAGSIGANNLNLGVGAGAWWKKNRFSISVNYVAANGGGSEAGQGGIATKDSGSTSTVQIGYSADQWAIAAIYSAVQNGQGLILYATNFTLASFRNSGYTSAFGLSGYWQPAQSGWVPSISVGWGINRTTYSSDVNDLGLVSLSQSWAVGLQWSDAFAKGNTLGMAAGQATFATSLYGSDTPNDGNYAWEWWYSIQLTDNIAVTPAIFYLYRPLGADTPAGKSFNQLGCLIKVSFRF